MILPNFSVRINPSIKLIIMKNLLILSLAILIISCNTSSKQAKEASESVSTMTETQAQDTAPSDSVKFKSRGIQTIYSAYEKLRDALVATDYETAKTFAAELSEALKADENTQQQASMADGIMNAGEIEAARVVFSKLNNAMEDVFEGAIASGTLNKCYCPMALDNTGASWFSTSKEINNPYFGDKMLKCGSIKKVIQ